jgi:cell fate regulator YaaT (PSP1 superfamily)
VAREVSGPRGEDRQVVGVRFSPTGRVIDYDSGSMVYRQGEVVVVDDRRGGSVATVSIPTRTRKVAGSLGRILRRAEQRDLQRAKEDARRQQDALAYARSRARAMHMPVKVFQVDIHGDRTVFSFSSEKRVDFRDLVRDLSARLHARVEMRQVGVRDEAKHVGGIGSCGREQCCSTFLPHFAPVSIKMAKNQRLVLNPTKVAGRCSRLKCCLMYEDAQYVEAGKGLPKQGKQVQTPDGIGRVDDIDVLTRRVRVTFFDKPPEVYNADEIQQLAPNPPPPAQGKGQGRPPQGRPPQGPRSDAHQADGHDDHESHEDAHDALEAHDDLHREALAALEAHDDHVPHDEHVAHDDHEAHPEADVIADSAPEQDSGENQG